MLTFQHRRPQICKLPRVYPQPNRTHTLQFTSYNRPTNDYNMHIVVFAVYGARLTDILQHARV
jgi:hypothetical protein